MQQKKLPMVEDLRRVGPRRIPRASHRAQIQSRGHGGADGALFATTDLDATTGESQRHRPGRPAASDAIEGIAARVAAFRKSTVTRRLNHRLAKLNARLHILDAC